jgi:hypothetical protein
MIFMAYLFMLILQLVFNLYFLLLSRAAKSRQSLVRKVDAEKECFFSSFILMHIRLDILLLSSNVTAAMYR